MLQIGAVIMVLGLSYAGIQGLRGVPDKNGKKTNPIVAAICLILAVAVVILAFVVLPRFLPQPFAR